MAALNIAFTSLVDLSLWYDVKQGNALTLASIPTIAQLRWTYLRDSWEILKASIIQKANMSVDPATLLQQVDDFSDLVESQRNTLNTVNPLKDQSTFQKYFVLFQAIKIDELPLTTEESKIITQETTRVQGFTKTTFKQIISKLITARDEEADIIDGTDATYNTIVGRSPVSALKTKTPADIQNIQYLQDAVKSVEYILCNRFNRILQILNILYIGRRNARKH
jgi:hypothetical protein